MSQELREIYADADAVAKATGEKLLTLAKAAIAARGVFTLALSGGSTPKKLYSLLATEPAFRDFPWAKTQLFFGDERHVLPVHADSNYLMVKQTLLKSGLVPDANLHRVQAELPDAAAAAEQYETEMKVVFADTMRTDGFPRFDAILLGMGPDGHTASLFPGSPGLAEKQRWVIANWVEKFKTSRITFTFPVLDAADNVLLLIAGADKADMLHEVLVTKATLYPVMQVQPQGAKIWMLDHAAAARLPQG